jgi:probable rRNA maturation factor
MDPEGPARRSGALRVVIGDDRGRRVRSAPALARWLRTIAPARARGTVSVAVVSDQRVRALNRQYRGVNRATDVLSFPTDHRLPTTEHCLGDIVIARGVARRQAREAGHSELTEWRVLALHGLLHLLGYDHERDGGRMRRVERKLRRQGGLPDGLIDRAGRS